MQKVIFAGFVLLAFSFISQAQTVTGITKDNLGNPLDKSTVSLLKAKDSSVVKISISNGKGAFSLPAEAGAYLLYVTHVGYSPVYTPSFEVLAGNAKDVGDIALQKFDGTLQGVSVSSKRPMVEVAADKMILNIEGTINATGSDALELLRKAPAVQVDKDDNISLAGKNGVTVYIDGRRSPLAGADLANYLKTMQASQIDAIEIITNPSAKYDAAGNAGIINIRLKKNKAFGTNGSANAGYTQGFYPKYNGGINLNHRNKGFNVFGSYSYNKNKNRMVITSDRYQLDTLFAQRNKMIFQNESHNYKAGIDFFLSPKSTVGAVVNGNVSDIDINTSGPTNFTYVPTNTLTRIIKSTNSNEIQRDNINTNLNYKYSVANGVDFNIDLDYGYFNNNSDQYQPNYYFLPNGTTETSRTIYNMIAPSKINLYGAKADYENNFKGGKLGAGVKFGLVNSDNDFQRFDVFTNSKILDTAKSNQFEYDENISAGYVNYNRPLKNGISIQVGLRVENTHTEGRSYGFVKRSNNWTKYDSTFKRDYTDVFPSASISFNKNPMNQWTVSYSRRIDRPAYQDLNPFEFKVNEYLFMKGNTELTPQYTNSFTLTNIFKYRLTTSLSYSRVNDIFAQIPDTTEKTKIFLIKKNFATQDIVNLSISYPFQYKWWSVFATANTNFQHYKADFGGGNRKVDEKVYTLTFYMQNSFTLGKKEKGWTAELSTLYLSPSIYQGFFKAKQMWNVDIGLQKSILKGKGTLKAVCNDVFQTMWWGGSSDFTGVKSYVHGKGEMPQFKFNFSYRFGNSQVKAARQRKTGIDAETKRANDGGGQGGPQ